MLHYDHFSEVVTSEDCQAILTSYYTIPSWDKLKTNKIYTVPNLPDSNTDSNTGWLSVRIICLNEL